MLDTQGNMYIEEDDLIELMLSNRQVKILPRDTQVYKTFEAQCKSYGIASPFILDSAVSGVEWNLPDNYKTLNILDHLKNKHELTASQWSRVDMELAEFKQRNLNDLLRFLIYFVDQLRSNNIIYGVGRGSSIASYVLFLIGIHRIDSYRHNLDIKEFLR
jgi:DNA polymerase III alpha subunit